MRVFAMLALGASLLFATASTHAHSHPATPKGLAPAHTYKVVTDSVAAFSPTIGPSFHSSPHVSSGGFHSTPSYHSYSATPSRSFSFRSSSPSISTRPAITTAPRTYTYSPSTSTRPVTTSTPRTYTYYASGVPHTKTYTPPARSSSPAEVHHYHNNGSGGMSTMDYLVLNQVMNGHQSSDNGGGTAAARFTFSQREIVDPADFSDDRMPTWLIVCFAVIGTLCIGAIIYGLVVYLDLDS